jgi:CDP-diacylglycerol--serine O-phosphatidyltransferase
MAFFVYLGPLNMVAIWVLVIVEFCGQFLVRYIIKRFTKLSVEANNFGKTKAVLCYALIIYFAVLDGDLQLPDFTSEILQLCIVLSIASSIFKIIPNRLYADILSTLNLISGITGIVLTWRGRYVLAAIAVLAGQFFDVLDGRMAEKHGGTKFGPWLDDIADLVSFGLCPGLLIFVQGNLKLSSLLVAMIYSCAVGFRLWRFVARDKHNKSLPPNVFNGLPSPAGALVALGACLFWQNFWISALVIIVTACLLVSHVRFIHFRSVIRHVSRNIVVMFGFTVVFVIGYLIKARNPKMLGAALLITFLLYALGGNSKLLGKRIIRSR